jgi:hypothetical protein
MADPMMMSARTGADAGQPLLTLAGGLDVFAAVLHLICIAVGAEAYRLLGAGPGMVRMVAAGHWYPAVVTSGIAVGLLLFAAYAFGGARLLSPPPLLRAGLIAISAIFLLRATLIIPALVAAHGGAARFHVGGAGGSISFWVWSSLVCLAFGLVHLAGTIASWTRL